MEDNPDILANIETALTTRGFEVATMNTGNGAVDNIIKSGPDLVILDIMIPKPNGYQICYMLKASVLTKHIPVILISAKNQELDVKLGYRMGADHYISKPFKNEDLLKSIRILLKE